MTQSNHTEYLGEYEDHTFAETPFVEPRYENESYEESARPIEESPAAAPWNFESPFEAEASFETSEAQFSAPEAAALLEITSELTDHLFREALEGLATEALETNAAELASQYGDREQRDASSERLLLDHFAPLSSQLESSLERLFEQLESYEVGALTEAEVDRLVGEIAPPLAPFAPAAEQFIGRFIRKAGKLVAGSARAVRSGVKSAARHVGKGLAAVGKLALGPLLKGLKRLGAFLLKHVVKFALGQLPPALQPLGRQLSDRLFHAVGVAPESELGDHEQNEGESAPAGVDVARLEAEFDVAVAQLALAPEETEADTIAARYGETESAGPSLGELDDARAQFARELQNLEAGESPQPVMEQFLPALLWPVTKTAITLLGRRKLVGVLGNLLAGLIKPMIGEQPARQLGPAIADAGLHLFGLETGGVPANPRALTAEALAASVEETINRISELPPSALENETLLESAVREAFEDAAATYFPSSHIKPELRETEDGRGVWMRVPHESEAKRYAKYSERIPVEITPRVAQGIHTFGHATLRDHIRDRMDVPASQAVKTNVRLYQVLPGTTTSSIARAEGIHPRDLHPLTPHAAGALLGPGGAGLGRPASPGAPAPPIASPHDLRLRQRLYYVEPPGGRRHHLRGHGHSVRSELSIDLRKGEIKLWLYLSEPLAQKVAAELAKPHGASSAFRTVHPLIERATALLRAAVTARRLPPALRIFGEGATLEHHAPRWVRAAGAELAAKIDAWVSHEVAQYLHLQHGCEQLRKLVVSEQGSEQGGVTLRIALSRIPGIETLRQLEKGHAPRALHGGAWLRGTPTVEILAKPGHVIR
jgi:hypothetical protein